MNMFLSLVSTLTKPELNRITEEIHCTGTEEKLLQAVLNVTDSSKTISKKELITSLELTSSHFDKLCSILFEKCLTLFAGENYQKKAFFLNGKYLHEIRLHYLLLYEKKHINEMSNTEKKEFYEFAYNVNLYGNTWQGDNPKVIEFAEKYYSILPTDDDKLYINALTLKARIDFFRRANLSEQEKSELAQEVESLIKQCENKNTIKLQFEAFVTGLLFYSRISGDSNKGKHYAGKAYALCVHNPDILPDPQILLVLMEIAALYYLEGENESAYQVFHRIYNNYYDLAKKLYRSVEQFTQVCLLMDKYDEAWELIQEYWLHSCSVYHEALTVPACIMVAKYYLLTEQYKQAFSLIEMAEIHVDKNRFFHTDVQIRNLKVLFFALTRDSETALMLCQRNIKYLHSKAESKERAMFTAFFRILQSYIQNPHKNLTSRQHKELEFFKKGTAGVYGIFLDKVRTLYQSQQ